MFLYHLLNKNVYLCKVKRTFIKNGINHSYSWCTAYDFKVMLEEKKPKSWLKSVSAFTNGFGGSLFFGIDNDGIVKGLEDVQHVCEAISSRIRDCIDPLPEVEMIPHDIDVLHILQLRGHQGQACVFSPCRLCPRANPFILLTNQSVLPNDSIWWIFYKYFSRSITIERDFLYLCICFAPYIGILRS